MTPQNSTAKKVPIVFTRTVAAQLARVSLDFLDRLEAEELLQPRELEGGARGYTPEDIARLCRIRRLHDTLGLDLEAVEVILQLQGAGVLPVNPDGGDGGPVCPAGAGTAAGTGRPAPPLPGHPGAGVGM